MRVARYQQAGTTCVKEPRVGGCFLPKGSFSGGLTRAAYYRCTPFWVE